MQSTFKYSRFVLLIWPVLAALQIAHRWLASALKPQPKGPTAGYPLIKKRNNLAVAFPGIIYRLCINVKPTYE